MSIAVVGEALFDFIPQGDGIFRAFAGGSPFNVARALGRQGTGCSYLSPISKDGFGAQLVKALEEDGVFISESNRSNKPSSLAFVSFDSDHQPQYSLYREGIADRDYHGVSLLDHLPFDTNAIHTGSLALVPGDEAHIRSILEFARHHSKLISMDINMRPNVVADEKAYVDTINNLLPFCDLVKASDEDLEILGLSGRPESLCNELRLRSQAKLAVVTLGAEGAIACTKSVQIKQACLPVSDIKDTVGAGDCFMAGLLSSLHAQGYLSPETLGTLKHPDLAVSMRRAGATASLNIMREGCQPPHYSELEKYLKNIESSCH